MPPTKLRITSLKFISAVDAGAQGEIANVALIKRAPTGDEFQLTCKVAKLDESIGVVFGYAVASTVDGGKTPHIDLQSDAVAGGDDLIKVALGFAEAGAQSDVMHDCVKDGWVPFVMPLNADTKKAFKLSGDVEGIAIGMKPSVETFKRFVSGELAAFSIYGTGERTPLEKRRVEKQATLTDLVEGHQHGLDLDDPADPWCRDRLSTTYQTAEGATEGHSHAWVYDAQGVVTIAADSGHTHKVMDKVALETIAAAAVQEAAEAAALLAEPSAVCEPITDEPSSGKLINVVIAARAPALKSTPRVATPSVIKTENTQMPTEQEKQIADLTAKLAKAERLATLTDAQRAHVGKLGADGEAYLAKSFAERDAVLADIEKSNEVVYTSTSTGETFRKSDDPRLVTMAKRQDESAVELAKRDEAIEKAEIAVIAKAHLGNVAGDDATHAYIVKSIRKGGGDAAMITAALATLKGANALAGEKRVAKGANPGTEPQDGSPASAFDALVAKTATEKSVSIPAATVLVADTAEGKRLYGEMQKAKTASA